MTIIAEVTQKLVNDPPFSNQSWGVGDLSRQNLLGAVKALNGFSGATNKGIKDLVNAAVVGAGVETSHKER